MLDTHTRRNFGIDHRSRTNHRLHSPSVQPSRVHDLLRLLGLRPLCTRPARASHDAELNVGALSLALDRESVCVELLAPVGQHALEPHDSGSSRIILRSSCAQGDIWGFFDGVEGTLLLSLASIIFALLIATIPMTARRILLGEYSPVGAAIAWGRAAASKALAGGAAAATGGAAGVAGAAAGGGSLAAASGSSGALAGGGTLAPAGGAVMAGGGGVIPGVNAPLTAPPHTPPAVRGHSLVRRSSRRRKHALQRKDQRHALFVRHGLRLEQQQEVRNVRTQEAKDRRSRKTRAAALHQVLRA